MFKKITIGKKIVLGFAAVLILMMIVGAGGYNGMREAAVGFAQYREIARDTNLAGRLEASMLMVRMKVKDFILTAGEEHLEQYNAYWKEMEEFLKSAQEEIKKPERAAKIDEVEAALKEYRTSFDQVVAYMNDRKRQVSEVLDVEGPLMEKSLTEIMMSANSDGDAAASHYSGLVLRNTLLARLYATKFLDTNDEKAVGRVRDEFAKMEKSIDTLESEINDPKRRQYLASLMEAKTTYLEGFDDLVKTLSERNKLIDAMDRLGPVVANALAEVNVDIIAEQDKLGPQLAAANQKGILLVSIVSGLGLLIGIFLAIIITRAITRPLSRVIEGLTDGAEQVAAASGQVSAPRADGRRIV